MGNGCACNREGKVSGPFLPSEDTEESEIQWKQGKVLSYGEYGTVYDCLDVRTGKIYAVKHLQSSSLILESDQLAQLKEHVKRLRALDHPHILKYVTVEPVPGGRGIYIIMENAPGGSLKFTRQLLEGLAFLHKEGFVHTDVKAANLLLTNKQGLKIGDLGRCVRPGEAPPGATGSPYWMAPELARGQACTWACDIWAVGCTVIEMLTGLPPWQQVEPSASSILRHLETVVEPPEFPPGISEECRALLSYCLRVDPSTRVKAKALLRMACVADV